MSEESHGGAPMRVIPGCALCSPVISVRLTGPRTARPSETLRIELLSCDAASAWLATHRGVMRTMSFGRESHCSASGEVLTGFQAALLTETIGQLSRNRRA
jgi:hypothetical protein